MVMVVVIVLSVLAFGFAYSMKVETTLARHAMFTSELDWAGRSGLEVAKWVLAEESKAQKAMFDSLRSKWAGGPGDSNSPLTAIDLKNYPLSKPDGSAFATISIEIVDNERKFNINTADVKELMKLEGVGRRVAEKIVEYREAHGPFRKPDELRKVEGVGDSLWERNRTRIVIN